MGTPRRRLSADEQWQAGSTRKSLSKVANSPQQAVFTSELYLLASLLARLELLENKVESIGKTIKHHHTEGLRSRLSPDSFTPLCNQGGNG
jgi:hypothetical protein